MPAHLTLPQAFSSRKAGSIGSTGFLAAERRKRCKG
jgi:hypothetical protein